MGASPVFTSAAEQKVDWQLSPQMQGVAGGASGVVFETGASDACAGLSSTFGAEVPVSVFAGVSGLITFSSFFVVSNFAAPASTVEEGAGMAAFSAVDDALATAGGDVRFLFLLSIGLCCLCTRSAIGSLSVVDGVLATAGATSGFFSSFASDFAVCVSGAGMAAFSEVDGVFANWRGDVGFLFLLSIGLCCLSVLKTEQAAEEGLNRNEQQLDCYSKTPLTETHL